MAVRVITKYVDDIDGAEAEGTVSFAFQGRSYEIDLSAKNREALERALEPFISAARRAGSARSRSDRVPGRRRDLAAIRAWAKENGHSVAERGRVPSRVIEAFDTAVDARGARD